MNHDDQPRFEPAETTVGPPVDETGPPLSPDPEALAASVGSQEALPLAAPVEEPTDPAVTEQVTSRPVAREQTGASTACAARARHFLTSGAMAFRPDPSSRSTRGRGPAAR